MRFQFLNIFSFLRTLLFALNSINFQEFTFLPVVSLQDLGFLVRGPNYCIELVDHG